MAATIAHGLNNDGYVVMCMLDTATIPALRRPGPQKPRRTQSEEKAQTEGWRPSHYDPNNVQGILVGETVPVAACCGLIAVDLLLRARWLWLSKAVSAAGPNMTVPQSRVAGWLAGISTRHRRQLCTFLQDFGADRQPVHSRPPNSCWKGLLSIKVTSFKPSRHTARCAVKASDTRRL